MADNTLQRAMLFDFFGELLTDKQREYFDLHYNEDLSLSEIAEQGGISRQGVWDIIRRADSVLAEYERKTGVIQRFNELRALTGDMQDDIAVLLETTEGRAREAALRLQEKLNRMEG